jgi:hypothetical protein
MAAIDSLNAAYANVAANLAAITANPKPSYDIDGEHYSWQELFDSYTKQLLVLKQRIQDEGGPFEIVMRGCT